jgi:hypothetical protein
VGSFSIQVQGLIGRSTRKTWYAKIIGFDLGDQESEEVDLTHRAEDEVTVCWFHDCQDPLVRLSGTMRDPELAAIKKALNGAPYLLGSTHQKISVGTIQGGEYQHQQRLLAGSDRSIRQNFPRECIRTLCH